jgi:hypothetical protein
MTLFGCLNLGGGHEKIFAIFVFSNLSNYDLNIIGSKNYMGIARTCVICISIL